LRIEKGFSFNKILSRLSRKDLAQQLDRDKAGESLRGKNKYVRNARSAGG